MTLGNAMTRVVLLSRKKKVWASEIHTELKSYL